jgi:hypothetical protein
MSSGNLSNIITSFTLYKFLDALTMPFVKTDAYKLGIIDAKGNLLKNIHTLNPTEKAAYNDFYQLVFSLKKLLMKVPDPYVRASLSNVVGSLRVISEECESLGGNGEEFITRALRELYACRLLNEEGEGGVVSTTPANSVSAGGIYGLKPEEATFLSKEGQKRHTSTNSIFKRRKPNRYYNDQTNSY